MSENSNSQTPGAATPVPPAGPTLEELQAKLAEKERESEGRLREIQDERRKRQELEARVNSPAPAPSAAKPDEVQDELGKVLEPYIKPLKQRTEAAEGMIRKYQEDQAIDLIAGRLGKPKSDVMADSKFQERFLQTQKKYGVVGGSIVETSLKVLDIMELEDLKQKESERTRASSAGAVSGMPQGTPPAPNLSKKELSQEDFDKMPLHEYDKLTANGSFVQDPQTGKIVYTPN